MSIQDVFPIKSKMLMYESYCEFWATIATNENQQSAVEIQHADQPEKTEDNTEAEEAFERDIAAAEEAVKSQSFDDIIEDLSD